MPFEALGLSEDIRKAIADAGYAEPTPIQSKAIPVILSGKDTIGIAQTGTGKTAAFVLPILEKLIQGTARQDTRGNRTPRALVLAPTRELALQVDENVRAYSKYLPLRCAAVFGGVSEKPQINTLRQGVDIIVATPGRLLDLMSTLSANVREIELLVLDEADRMLDMGFIPDIRRIIRALPYDRQSLLFSATFPAEVEKLSREFLREPETVEIGQRATPTDSVAQFVYEVPMNRKLDLLAHILKDEDLDCVLVFTRTKIGADRLARGLYKEGIPTATLHSNRSQGERLAALKGFKGGHYRVLVATDIAARGIDVDGISHVVNYDFPNHPEDYVHRIGRTGRAQAIGDALSFATFDDLPALKELEKFIGRGIPRKEVEGITLPALSPDHGPIRRPARGGRRSGPSSEGSGRPRRSSSGGGSGDGQRGGDARRRSDGQKGGGDRPARRRGGRPPAAEGKRPPRGGNAPAPASPARTQAAPPAPAPSRSPAPADPAGATIPETPTTFGRRSKKSRRR